MTKWSANYILKKIFSLFAAVGMNKFVFASAKSLKNFPDPLTSCKYRWSYSLNINVLNITFNFFLFLSFYIYMNSV